MALNRTLFHDDQNPVGVDLRAGIGGGLVAFDGANRRARQGILRGCSASGVGSSLSWTLDAGAVAINGTSDSDGTYLLGLSATTVTHTARDATYSRRDLVGVQVDGTGVATLKVVAGTPSASPQMPSPPAGVFLPLFSVLVPASGDLSVTQVAPQTTANGGVLPVTSTTRPPTTHLRPGQVIFETDTQRLAVWTGSAWRQFAADAFAGTEKPVLGSAVPPAGTPRFAQEWQDVYTIESSGGGVRIPFPTPFPNAVMALQITILDPGNTSHALYWAGCSTSQLYLSVSRTGTGAPVPQGDVVRVSVRAVGW